MQALIFPLSILAILTFVQTMLPAASKWMFGRFENGKRASMAQILGPRDTQPELPLVGQRAQRALSNLNETLMVLLPVLAIVIISGASGAITGLWVLVIARVLYLGCYLIGVSTVRSLVWAAGYVGITMMLVAAISS